jgi:hypothetical protein
MRRKEEKAGKKVTRRNAILKIYSAHASESFSKKPSFERLCVILSNRAVRHFVRFAELILGQPELNVIRDANTSSNAASLDKFSLTE